MITETKRAGRWAVSTQGLRTAGEDEAMLFDVGPVQCDNIDDGIALSIGTGYWFVSFEDFEQIYELAKEVRGNNG